MNKPSPPRIKTGVPGLDFILGGGLPSDRLYLVEGNPGTGKTTLALRFLMTGSALGEPTLYITLAETADELRSVALSHDWSLEGIDVVELLPPDAVLRPESQYTVFHPAEVELDQSTRQIYERVAATNPTRVVIDSLSEMRILSQDALRLRRQVLALKHFFLGRGCTVLLLDDVRSQDSELQFASIAHGVITLEQMALEYGAERRRLRVLKLRGQRFRGGFHDFTIQTGGIVAYPRLVAAEHEIVPAEGFLSSGNTEFDQLIGGGPDRGTSTLLVGPAGVGKSVLCTQYAVAAAERGEKVATYLFDERMRTFMARAKGLGMRLDAAIASGNLNVQQIDPAEISPGQFAHEVCRSVETHGTSLVIIDSLSGYMNAMPGEQLLSIHLHELLSYLTQRGVTTLLTLAQHGPFAHSSSQGAEISYLTDGIVLLRYFEASGQVRQAISVLKKRSGGHEQTIREFRIGEGGFRVGEPLRTFQGVLTGVPEYLGATGPLLDPVADGSSLP